MDNLFGVPLSSYLIALTGLVVLILGFLAWIWFRNPLLVRMGLRNLLRRKTQTALIVVGLMLSTLIISAAFATGDTVGYSITNTVFREFGEADIVIAFDADEADPGLVELTDEDVAALAQFLEGDENLSGVTGVTQVPVPALNTADRRAEPRATFAGVDPATVAAFNGLRTSAGETLDPAQLGEDRAYITERLSDEIGVGEGDRFTIFYNNEPHEFTAIGVVVDNAMTSPGDDQTGFTSGGLVTTLERWREITGEGNRIDLIAISAVGGVRDSLDRIDPLQDRVEEFIESTGAPMDIIVTKAEAVELAELVGSVFVTLFIVFGLFSIAAGIMLIFLTFVMLAAERRSEMGMARAVGMKRTHLTQSFVAEGMAYNIGSALIGALLGVGVAAILVWAMGQILSEFGVDISFHFNPQGFAIAYFLGIVITFATVTFSSWRAANLNIVAAIRDLPEEEFFRSNDRSLGRLLRAMVAVIWTLVWIALIAIWAVAAFIFFTIGLATYGLGLLAGGVLAAAFVWGVTRVNRSFRSMGWLSRIGYVLWWIAFNVMALVTWLLFRTRAWSARNRNSGGWAMWMLIIGGLAIWWGGWVGDQQFAYTGGTTLVIFALAMLAVYFGVPAKPAFTIASIASLWYWMLPLPFSLFSDVTMSDETSPATDPLNAFMSLFGLEHGEITGNIEMFFVSGLAITASATLFVIFNADRLLASLGILTRILGGITPAVRMAISYPLAAKFRTAMTLAMFGLVVFSLVVMATLNHNFTQLFLGDDARGGFDVTVRANPSNRIPDLREALTDAGFDVDAGITGIGTLRTAFPEMKAVGSEDGYRAYRLQGVDEEFTRLAALPLVTRANGYESDEAVFEALRTDPTVAIIDESRTAAQQDPFEGGGGEQFHMGVNTGDLEAAPWDPLPISIRDRETGNITELKVIAVIAPQATGVISDWFAVFANESVIEESFGGGETESFYLTTSEQSKDATVTVASEIEAALLERGVVADSIRQTIDDFASQSNAFQYLFEGFMGLGLIVGIAALGVIAFRTVAERRQQIGMMRAIGYSRRLIGMSFFLESSFIALTGIGMGLVLGAALSYNLLSSPEFVGESGAEIDFSIPWVRLLVIIGIAYAASALMTLIPARSASRVPVAEALRYSG